MDDLIRRLTTRRNMLTGAAAFALTACAGTSKSSEPPPRDAYPADEPVTSEYRQEEITDSVANFFGVTAKGAAEVRTCVLLDKKARRTVPFEADYVGFDIPNEFVVGYGLDFNERYRNLPCIGVLKPKYYAGS